MSGDELSREEFETALSLYALSLVRGHKADRARWDEQRDTVLNSYAALHTRLAVAEARVAELELERERERDGYKRTATAAMSERDEARATYQRAVSRLSRACGNPCLEFGDEKTIEEAVVDFAAERCEGYIAAINQCDAAVRRAEEAEKAERDREDAIAAAWMDDSRVGIEAIAALARFGALVAKECFSGDFGGLDGGDVQDMAIRAGMLVLYEGEPHEDCEACADGGPCYVIPDRPVNVFAAVESLALELAEEEER